MALLFRYCKGSVNGKTPNRMSHIHASKPFCMMQLVLSEL